MTTLDKKRCRCTLLSTTLLNVYIQSDRQIKKKKIDSVGVVLNGPLTTRSHDLLKTDLEVAHGRGHKRMFSMCVCDGRVD